MSKSKKISLLLTTLVATTTFSTNCFAMKKNNSKQHSNNNTINIINTFKNEDDIKLLEKKRNPEKKTTKISKQEDKLKPINTANQNPTNNSNNSNTPTLTSKQKSELKSKIIDKETSKSKNSNDNNKLMKPIFMESINTANQNPTNNNIITNTPTSKQEDELKLENIKEEASKSNNKLMKPILVGFNNFKNQNPTNNNIITNTLTSKQEDENTITKSLIDLKNELETKIKYLENLREKLNQNIFNYKKDVLDDQITKYEETLVYVKDFNNKFNKIMNSEINEQTKKEFEKPVNKKLIEEIFEILKNFKETYSNFMNKGLEKIELDDVINDIENKLNNPKTNKLVIEKNYDSKTLIKEKYKNNILMELFITRLKVEYTKCINLCLKNIDKNNENYFKDDLVIKKSIDKDTIDSLQKKYNIFVYFPQSFIQSRTNSSLSTIYTNIIHNRKEILKTAAASTIKALKVAARLNIRFGISDEKFQNEFQNQVNYKLTEKDYDEIYNELDNISINDDCYNIFTDFKNSLSKINFGTINEKNECVQY